MLALGGDANLDGTVDSSKSFHSHVKLEEDGHDMGPGVFNYDGRVDSSDLSILTSNWKRTMPSGYGAGPSHWCPKPGTAVLLAVGLIGLLRCARHRRK